MQTIVTLLLITAPLFSQNMADEIDATVVRIIDGDTFVASVDGESVIVRINGIDAPEGKQPYGDTATMMLERLLPVDSKCRLTFWEKDRYGRWLCAVLNYDYNFVAIEMLKNGGAWIWKFADAPALEQFEASARRERRGLWSATHPIDPYDWRKGKRD